MHPTGGRPENLAAWDLAGADAALRQVAQRVCREAAVTSRTVVVFRDGESAWGKPDWEYLPQGRSIGGDET